MRDYTFHLRSGCADDASRGKYGVPRGRFAVEVQDRQVVKIVALDERARLALAGGRTGDVPSVSGLFELLQDASADGAEVVSAEYGGDGHLTQLVLDDDQDRAGDANCFTVTEYRPS